MNIQERLNNLQPYLIGIRYLEGTPVIDVVLKEGWTLPEDQSIKKTKGNDELNYYMIYSEVAGIGLDDLLNFVDKTIKLNIDREKKHDLLRIKVNELKEVFKKNTLVKLERLKFVFNDEDLTPTISDLDIDLDVQDETPAYIVEETIIEEQEKLIEPTNNINNFVDENGKEIELTDEEKELIEEEARAEKNRKILATKNIESKKLGKKIELPPKRKTEIITNSYEYESDCDCSDTEACNKCVDKKGY